MKLNVGRIGKAHGILGEATIEIRTDEAENRFAIGAVLETDNHGELTVVSAHRTPLRMVDYGTTAKERGLKVIIAGAG